MPFFSIIVPTKNREVLLKDCLWSILRQTFADFDVHLIDNSDKPLSESKYTNQDHRIKYHRTGNLDMCQNWYKGLEVASGNYILILSDRLVWSTKYFLESLYIKLKGQSNEVASWKFVQARSVGRNAPRRSNTFSEYTSKDILDSALNINLRFFSDVAPRGLNSAFRIDKIVNFLNNHSYRSLRASPDYTLATHLLMDCEKVLHLDSNIIYEQGLNVSTGLSAINKSFYNDVFIESVGVYSSSLYSDVPLNFVTIYNGVVNDIIRILKKNYKINYNDLNLQEYIKIIVNDLSIIIDYEYVNECYKELSVFAKIQGLQIPKLKSRNISYESIAENELICPDIKTLVENYEHRILNRKILN